MSVKKVFALFLLFFFIQHVNGFKRVLYVDNFSSIVGNTTSENKLLSFAKRYGFNCLLLYDLNKIHKKYPLKDRSTNSILANFISKAKSTYNIDEIGAIGETSDFFVDVIDPYNESRNSIYEKFNVYNLEYEYWSNKASGEDGYYCENYLKYDNYECTRQGSFQHFMDDLKTLKSLADQKSYKIKVAVFLGWFKEHELKEIHKYSDRLILESYDKNPKLCYFKTKKRLSFIKSFSPDIETSVIFSSTMQNMGKWFKYDSLDKTENIFLNEMKTKNSELAKHLKVKSFGYHCYSYLEKSLSYYAYSQN